MISQVLQLRKSSALQAFERKLDDPNILLRLMHRRAVEIPADLPSKANELLNSRKNVPDQDWENTWKTALKDDLGFIESVNFLYDWMLVTHVTFAEAYLEDALLLLFERNPDWMKKSKVQISYSELTEAGSSPEGLKAIQGRWRSCWVKKIIRDKPKDWINLLKKSGVKEYRANLAEEMEAVWSKRNEIVHTGLTSSEAAKHLIGSEYVKAVSVIDSFMAATDHFVVELLEAYPVVRSQPHANSES